MILITGASQGIGYASARLLLERTKLEVLITGRRESRLRAARENVPEFFRRRLQIRSSDQACRADIDSLCAFVADPATPIDGAILTVGVNPVYTEGPRRLHSLDPATMETIIRTNCTHTLLLTAAILQRFRKQNGGVLIWIGSQAQRIGIAGSGLYCATKSFLCGLAAAAHHEYADRGVRVHLVNPGLVRTPRTAAVADRFAAANDLSISEAPDVASRIVDLLLLPTSREVEINL